MTREARLKTVWKYDLHMYMREVYFGNRARGTKIDRSEEGRQRRVEVRMGG
jgi:hypothetical protein